MTAAGNVGRTLDGVEGHLARECELDHLPHLEGGHEPAQPVEPPYEISLVAEQAEVDQRVLVRIGGAQREAPAREHLHRPGAEQPDAGHLWARTGDGEGQDLHVRPPGAGEPEL
ncbi:MAG: hypothetical protein ACLP0J_05115 [Solirubrobacteraceae bacterium]